MPEINLYALGLVETGSPIAERKCEAEATRTEKSGCCIMDVQLPRPIRMLRMK